MKGLNHFSVGVSRKGFTLIELLVVTAILAVVVSAIVACLIGGIKAWDSVRDFNNIEVRALVGIEIMEKDLVNSFEFDGISFEGGEKEMSFAAPLVSAPDAEEPDVVRVGTVKYEFDEVSGVLRRKTWTYPETESDADAFEEVVISGVNDMSLEYYYYSQDETEDNDGGWQSGRDSGTNFVGGVRVSLIFPDEEEFVEIKRTIMFPISHMVTE